ncbi:MAG: ATP synthase F1 subunit epsilon [Cytophagales bacterium]
MKVEIVTPDKKVFEGEADGVQLPGTVGSFEVLKNHAPIVSTLAAGKIRVRTGKDAEFFQIAGGLVEVVDNKVIVLAESVVV